MFPWLQISLLKALEFEGQVQTKRIQVNIVQTEFLDFLIEQNTYIYVLNPSHILHKLEV